jgi:hypothetical protein
MEPTHRGDATMKKALVLVLFLAGMFPFSAMADDTLVQFKGGIGVNPSSRPLTRTIPVTGGPGGETVTVDTAVTNVVRGVIPGGQPWVIADLKVDVKVDGRIQVDGRGLLLAGGNNIGTPSIPAQMVRARLFCGAAVHQSGLVTLEANGDFRIDDVLTPVAPTTGAVPPSPCTTPVLLIVSAGGNWFAAGIPKLD